MPDWLAVIDRLLPPRLGADFRRLFYASAWSNLGDGLMLAAGPLLVARISRDPISVSGAAAMQLVPWLFISLIAGAIVDRVDRIRLFVVVNLVRVLTMAALTATVVTGAVSVPIIWVSMFVLGCAEVFSDITVSSLPPVVITEPADYGVGNSRLLATLLLGNQLIGPALAAPMFALAQSLPLSSTAVCWVLAIVQLARVHLPTPDRGPRRHLLREVSEGATWLWSHPPVRTLAVLIAGFNITYGAAWGVLVLLATDRLGLSERGYGLFLAMSAVGGLAGTWAYPRLERHFSLATLMRIGLILETLTHFAFAVLTNAIAASAVMFVFGVHAAIWGTTSNVIKQRTIPRDLFGRVNGIYLLCVFGSLVIGQGVGGWIARSHGLPATYWFAFIGSTLLTVGLWRQVRHVAHAAKA